MKKYILVPAFVLAFFVKTNAQSTVSHEDHASHVMGYQEMKEKGLLTKGGIRPQPSPAEAKRLGGSTRRLRLRSAGCSNFVPPGIPVLRPVDDSSTSSISLPFTFCFYGTNYTSCYINSNGNISFGASYTTFSSSPFPDPSYIMIAPFWADVDTRRGAGQITMTLMPTYMIVTWDSVGYFNERSDKLNSFQLIITDGVDPILPYGNNIAFNYGDMQWTTGEASGGVGGFGGTDDGTILRPVTPATVGINKGDGINYIQLGRFDSAGTYYDGGYGNDDGVDWLDYKSFYFNVCGSTNIPPIPDGFSCDTVKICSLGDTLILNGVFLSPETGQTTTVDINLGGMTGASILSNPPGNTAFSTLQIIASAANRGNHTITFTAYDDGTPAETTRVKVNISIDTSTGTHLHNYVTGDFSYCPGVTTTPVYISPTDYDSYIWSTGSKDTMSIYNVHDSALHWVTARYNGCYKSNIFDFTPAYPKDSTINPVPNLCVSGPPVMLTAVSSGGIWSGAGITDSINGIFKPSVAGVGDHIITYTQTNPCLSVGKITVHVVRQLSATITDVAPFCIGASAVTLSAVDAGGVWAGTGITNTATGAFDPTLAGIGTHIITYTIDTLCGDTDSTTIIVAAIPVISFTSDTTQGCEPATIHFTGVADQSGGTSSWSFGDATTSDVQSPTHVFENAGYYTVTFAYTNSAGCTSIVTHDSMILVHSQPKAIYSADPQPATIVNPDIHFTDLSTGVIDHWKWSFGTTDTSTVENPTYTYVDTGAFPIQLTVTNNYGCTSTTYGTVVINQILLLFAPNAFTPDGNGINDVFFVKGQDINPATFEMQIFNRWGELIYRTDDIGKGWNGGLNNNGSPLKQDEYVWKVDFLDYSNMKHSYIGHVLLLGQK